MGRNTEIREKVINHAPSFALSSNTRSLFPLLVPRRSTQIFTSFFFINYIKEASKDFRYPEDAKQNAQAHL